MEIGRLNLVTGALLGMLGLAIAAAGPALGPAFGVQGLPPAGGGSIEVPAEWRLVAFLRMFGVTVFTCGALLLAVGDHLQRERVRIFAGVVAAASGVASLLAIVQQTAIWNTVAGAMTATLFGALALAYGWIALGVEVDRGGRVREESGISATTAP